jgi:ribosomal protein L15E
VNPFFLTASLLPARGKSTARKKVREMAKTHHLQEFRRPEFATNCSITLHYLRS